MPRAHRSRSARRAERTIEEPSDLSYLLIGARRTEQRAGRSWSVQSISAAAAQKVYVCPGCPTPIAPGTAHVVVWRQDGVLGDKADLDARRHWHTHCWNLS